MSEMRDRGRQGFGDPSTRLWEDIVLARYLPRAIFRWMLGASYVQLRARLEGLNPGLG